VDANVIVSTIALVVSVPSGLLALRELRQPPRWPGLHHQPPPVGLPPATPPSGHGQPSPAPEATTVIGRLPLWRRIAAFGVDFLPALPAAIVGAVTEEPDGSSALMRGPEDYTALGNALYSLMLGLWVINLVWSCRTGRSFGKVVFGARVVDSARGGPIGAWRTMLRNALLWMSIGLAGALSLFRRDNRGLQDFAVRATVVAERRVPVPQR
jgi:uncharacterized RDD family membrane protein YckC